MVSITRMTSLQAQTFTGWSSLVNGLPGEGVVGVGFPLCPVSSKSGPNTNEAAPGAAPWPAAGVALTDARREVVAAESVWPVRRRGGTAPVDVTACPWPRRAGPVL
jgi:hypothetical protein